MDRRRFLLTSLAGVFTKPLATGAQQAGRTYRIGVLSSTAPSDNSRTVRERLRELGWSEGRNLVFADRYTGPDRERITTAAKELVDLRVDVIWTGGGAETPQAAMNATKTIPIVFAVGDDPVRLASSGVSRARTRTSRASRQ